MYIKRSTPLAGAIAVAVAASGYTTASPLLQGWGNGIIRAESTPFIGSGYISFGALRFDPLVAVPGEAAAYRAAADGRGLRFVQFNAAIESDWLESLKAAGLTPLQYYPDNTFLVWGDGSAANRVASLPQLRWQGEYLPEWKLSPDLGKREGVIRNVDVFFYNDGDVAGTLDTLRRAGAKVLTHGPAQPDKAFFDAWIEVDAALLPELSQLPQVVWLEFSHPEPTLSDEMSSQILARNYNASNVPQLGYLPWLASIGYNGSGVNWAVIDSGVDRTHPDLAPAIIGGTTYAGCPAGNGPGDDTSSGHGTHVAGIIAGTAAAGFADAQGFKYGQGVAPGAGIYAQNPICGGQSSWPPSGGWQQISKDALLGGAVGGNGSWQYAADGAGASYTAGARSWDQIIRDGNFDTAVAAEPFVMVFSAGNAGSGAGTLTPPKAAKNPIITGSSRNYRVSGATSTTIDTISTFSSRGPTNDGRFGVTISTPGERIASAIRIAGRTNCQEVIAGTSNHYAMCDGTSMASPHAAGASVLLTHWWKANNAGAVPSPAMIKALLINGARSMVGGSIPNPNVGWGRVDVPASMGLDYTSSVYVDQSAVLTSVGQVWEGNYGVVDTGKPLRISLAWTDAAAATGANPALVNNLDLEVITNGQTYLGNVFANNVSTTGGTADPRNNTEGVIIANPGSSVTIRVKATNLPGDAVPGNATVTDQDFALVCRNCANEPGFTLNATPATPLSICRPTNAQYTLDVGSILGYNTPVSLSVTGLPGGATSAFSPNPVTPAGTSTLTIGTAGVATPGTSSLTITGSNVDRSVSLTRELAIATTAPAAPGLSLPAHQSVGNPTTPTLTWAAAAQAVSYRVEVSTSNTFATTVIDTTVTGTSYAVPSGTPLVNGTTYYWRVTPTNACGTGGVSTVFQFRTAVAPGQCDVGQTQLTHFSEDFSAGIGGFTTTGSTGTATWALSTARPSPVSGGNAIKSANLTTTSNQLLTSPTIALPTGQSPLTLGFQRWRFLEINGTAACWDGGFMEIAVNGSAFSAIAPTKILNDPYTGPVGGGSPGWCSAAAVDWGTAGTLVDLSDWAGSNVQLRWRVTTDTSTAREGWYVDDIKVTGCGGDLIFQSGFDSN